ncbi:MAG: hypothetical protein AAF479_13095 [Pseudomonadota bacterium]
MQRESTSSRAFGGWLSRALLNVAGAGGIVTAGTAHDNVVQLIANGNASPDMFERLSDVELAHLGLSRGVLALRSGFEERPDETAAAGR